MSDRPEYLTNISLILSRVMDDIMVNEECILRRRRTNMVIEKLRSLGHKLCQNCTCYIFGSQTEGTTTDGLNSDTDLLSANEDINVIQDWKEWVRNKDNYLMIRDEKRYPGYCKLQVLRSDAPLPMRGNVQLGDVRFANDRDENIILKNNPNFSILPTGNIRHGPAVQRKEVEIEYDLVPSYRCKTWPYHYKQWTPNYKKRDWPTPEMVQYMKTTGCFLVNVAHRLDEQNVTWRISTSLAERCLMFSLNITQIKCYVLLKIIVKTFIEPFIPDTISSYMCKTILFHCIENTSKDIWTEHTLLKCVHNVLLCLIIAVRAENCPNYFNESANLFLGKVFDTNKNCLFESLTALLKTEGRFLLNINFENINSRLSTYIIDRNRVVAHAEIDSSKVKQCRPILRGILRNVCQCVRFVTRILRWSIRTIDDLLQMLTYFIKQGIIQREATRLVLPFICSYKATVEVSRCIRQGTEPTQTTLKIFELSLLSDVTSSRLRFASYLYCSGQLEMTLSVLEDVERRMTDSVLMMCGCHDIYHMEYPPSFGDKEVNQEYPTTDGLAMCVMFSKDEIQCCPRELQYELFRSTDEERRNRSIVDDDWMELVVIEPLPYLYFLQYMTYRQLGQRVQQHITLIKLIDCVCSNRYLIHRETAMNVLGQCLRYEGLLNYAFECYKKSLTMRSTNNAVRWHIILLLWFINGGVRR